jgi:ribosomal protein S7
MAIDKRLSLHDLRRSLHEPHRQLEPLGMARLRRSDEDVRWIRAKPDREQEMNMMVADEVIDAAEAAREAWQEYLERVDELKAAMRASDRPEVRFELERVEAYDALVGP